MYKKFLVLFLLLINVGFASAALSWGEWTANHNTDITITNGQLAEFEWTVQAYSSFQGVQGKYSIWLFRNGNNNPIRTYFYNQPTINNGAGGYINVTSSDYQNLIGDYQVKVYSVDYFGADTHVINLHVNPATNPLTVTCNANPTSGQAPFTTTYTATANGGSGVYVSYFWNFNDGQTQTTSTNTILHTYQNAGTYNGLITVTDNQGHTATANCPQVIVTPPPVPLTASCNAIPTSGYEPLDVDFYGTANGGSGTYYYYWQFNDGHSEYSENETTHTYQHNGTYNPTLKVTDSQNHIVTVNCPTINVQETPMQNITGTCYAIPPAGFAPLTTTLIVFANGGNGAYHYNWTFDDGTTGFTLINNIQHIFYNAGTYHPHVLVTDTIGNHATINCPTVTATQQPPQNLTLSCDAYPTQGTEPLNVNFEATITGSNQNQWTYIWTFDDGQTLTNGPNVLHTYNQGIYHPTVRATSDGNPTLYADCPTITVQEEPPEPLGADCDAFPTSGYEPLDVNFYGSATGGTGIYYYYWAYGDGHSQYGNNETIHRYQNNGTYTPILRVTDSSNAIVNVPCPTITVYPQPVINYTLSCDAWPTQGEEPLDVEFEATITAGSGVLNNDAPSTQWIFTWTFDDGQTLVDGSQVEHTYEDAGVYHPTVKATKPGTTLTANCPTITVEEEPLQNITGTCYAHPTSGYAPLTTNFTVYATGGTGTYTYKWLFDDGTTTNTPQNNILHTYYNPGNFEPTVIVIDNQGNSGTIYCPEIYVYQQPINYTLTCDADPTTGEEPLDVEFNAYISSDSSESINENINYVVDNDGVNINCNVDSATWVYTWTFDDGQTLIDGSNVWHTYYEGTYNPTVKATKGCTTIYANCPEIEVEEASEPLSASCDAWPTSGYEPLIVNFLGSASGGSGTYYYYWQFNDGHSEYSENETTHTYQNNGTYNPTLKVTDSQNHIVTVNCPTINVYNEPIITYNLTCDADPTNGYTPLNVNFNATITTSISNDAPSIPWIYTWTFNDGTTLTNGANVQHTYNQGIYHPTVRATSDGNPTLYANCPTINVQEQPIIITGICDARPTSGYEPLTVNFSFISAGQVRQYTYKWLFDDGTTLINGQKTTHTYDEGIYEPKVIVSYQGINATFNCPTITAIQPPQNLTASCDAYPTSGYKPLNVNFYGTANGGSGSYQYKWIFDDGQTQTTTQNTTLHTYYHRGNYNPTLKVTDSNNETIIVDCPEINVYKPPVNNTLECDAYPTTGYEPLEVEFNAELNIDDNYEPDCLAIDWTYHWIFDDGQTLNNGANVWHTYNQGTYNPRVQATDGCETYYAECPEINVQEEPPINITGVCNAEPTSGYEPLDVNFSFDSEPTNLSYTFIWIFDDGYASNNGSKVTHTYYEGTFNPKVEVSYMGHTQTFFCPEINVEEEPPTPLIASCDAYPTSGYAPLSVDFYGSATGGSGIYYYFWTYGDGHSEYDGNESIHIYTNNGTFHPTLKVTDSQNHIVTVNCPTITVEEPQQSLTASCNAIPTSGYEPLEVNFYGTANGGSGTYYYYWTYGDGYNQYALNETTHIYQNNGTFHPTLKVTDTQNHIITVNCPTINVLNNVVPPITGTCYIEPSLGYAPLDVNFEVNAQGGTGNYVSYNYVYDDGTSDISTFNTIVHTYFDPGQYHPYVIVKDDMNNSGNIYCGKVNVLQNIANLTASCDAYPTNGYAPLETTFEATANGGTGGYSYRWYFGDGISSLTNNNVIMHTYYDPGQYYPTLKVTDSSGTQVLVDCPTISVEEEPINYALSCDAWPIQGEEPLEVDFEATITQNNPDDGRANSDDPDATWTYTWIFDDGQTLVDGPEVEHTYEDHGTYYPTVQATKPGFTLTADCPIIIVEQCLCDIASNPNGPYKGYVGNQILIDGSASTGEIIKYEWDFGDGNTLTTTTPFAYHTYNSIDVFDVKLTVFNSRGDSDTGQTKATIIEETNYLPDKEPVDDGLYVGKILMTGEKGISEIARSNDDLRINVDVENEHDYDLDDARIIVEIPELGIKQKSTSFDLRTGQETDESISIQLWNVPEGVYPVKITVQDDNVRRVKYRDLFVKN